MPEHLKASRDIPSEMALIIGQETEPDFRPASLSLIKGPFTMMGTPWTVTGGTPPAPSVPAAPLHCLNFNGAGHFFGQINLRVSGAFLQTDVIGSYKLWHNTSLDIIDGRLWAWVAAFRVVNSFYIIRRNANRIDMAIRSNDSLSDGTDTDGPVVYNTTLKRVARVQFWQKWF